MIQKAKTIKAVGLLSGGLDSTLAVRMIHDLGVEVHGVYFSMPWGCCDKDKAAAAARVLNINFLVFQLDERYLDVIKKPRHGYGSAMNPCVDCRIHMFKRAGDYMRKIHADFVFTGEVLGQRPMSQMRRSMKIIEEEAGLAGRLLRPLCAQFMDETIPEKKGLIDRSQLLGLSGRSRRRQLELADKFQINNFMQPAGGCSLTDKRFANRIKDTFVHGYRNFRETISLQWGRHFRVNEHVKIIVGRDEKENDALKTYAHADDYIFEIPDKIGPTVLLKGQNPDHTLLELAASLVKHFSKHRERQSLNVEFWQTKNKNDIRVITGYPLEENKLQEMQI